MGRPQRRCGDLSQAGDQQPSHLVGPHDGPQDGLSDSPAVTQQDDVGGEDVEQTLHVTRLDRPAERVEGPSGLVRGDRPPGPARRDVGACPVGDLADGVPAPADGLGDLLVVEAEHLAEHEHRPLVRCERLHDQHHRHRDALRELDVLGHVGRGEQRLGQPGADVGLLPAAERAQPGQGLARGDPDQIGAPVPYGVEIDTGPPQPGLLEDVLRVGGGAQHLVGDGEEQVAVRDERLGGRAGRVGGPPRGVPRARGVVVLAVHRLLLTLRTRRSPAHRTPDPGLA